MNLYVWIVALHAAVAVLGTGQLAAIALVARAQRRGPVEQRTVAGTGTLAVTATWRLALLLVTGALAMYLGPAVFLGMWWMRISIVLFLALGALTGQVRGAARRGSAAPLARIEALGWVMCGVLFAIVVLMEAKPW